jgi:hypothetical protein
LIYLEKMMTSLALRRIAALLTVSAVTAGLTACGGSKNDNTSSAPKTLVSGQVIALGSALSGGLLNAYNAAGGVCGSTTTNGSGAYTLDVSNCTQPTLILASNGQGVDVAATLLTAGYTGLAAGSTAQANITPLTTALVDMMLGQPSQPLASYPSLVGPAAAGLTWTAEQQAVTALQTALSTAVPGYAAANPLTGGLTGTAGAQILGFSVVQTGAGISLQYQGSGGFAQTLTLPAIGNTPTSSPQPGALSVASLYEGHAFTFTGNLSYSKAVAATASAPASSAMVSDAVTCTGQMDLSGVVSGQCTVLDASGSTVSTLTGNILNPGSVPSTNTPVMVWQLSTGYGNFQPTFSPISGNYAVVGAQAQGFTGQALFH